MAAVAGQEKAKKATCELVVADEALICDPLGALYWPAEKTLIFSDLHLEKGSSFAKRGQLVPPYDTGTTLRLMALLIRAWRPERVISLGDSFHDDEAADRLPPLYLNQLAGMMQGLDWVWISGNHDPSPPEGLGGDHAIEMAMGNLVFRHEPELISSGKSKGEIAGHLHPAAKISRRGKAVRRRCFISDGERMIMPSFGAFTGGLNVRHPAFDNLFSWGQVHGYLLGKEAVYQIKGDQLVG